MNKSFLVLIIFAVMVAIIYVRQLIQQRGITSITAKEAKEKIAQRDSLSLIILDVRTKQEFNSGHLKGAKLVPVQELASRINELNKFKNKEILVYCRSGNRSVTASKILLANGFNAINMSGGIIAWNRIN